jgi:hypothetical protein
MRYGSGTSKLFNIQPWQYFYFYFTEDSKYFCPFLKLRFFLFCSGTDEVSRHKSLISSPASQAAHWAHFLGH